MLSTIHGVISPGDNGFTAITRLPNGDTDTHRHRLLKALYMQLCYQRSQPLGQSNGGINIGMSRQYNKLFAPPNVPGGHSHAVSFPLSAPGPPAHRHPRYGREHR